MELYRRTREKAVEKLRRTERYTRTDNVYLATSSFWLLVWEVVGFVMLFATSVAFANLLPKEVYGTYRYIISLSAVIGAFSLTGMNTAVTQAVARGFEGSYRAAVRVQLRWNVLLLPVTGLLATYYYIQGNRTIALGVAICGIASMLLTSTNTFSAYLNGKKNFKALAGYNIIVTTVTSLALLTGIFLYQNVPTLVLIYFGTLTAITTTCWYAVARRYPPNDSEDPNAIRYGKHLSILNILQVLVAQADRVLVFHFLGAVQLASYNVAIALPDQLRAVFKIVPTIALPKFAEKGSYVADRSLWVKLAKLAGLIACLAATYVILAPWIYNTFFPAYVDTVTYSQIFALLQIVIIPTLPLVSLLQARARVSSLYRYTSVTSVAELALLAVGAYYWGIYGVLFGKSVASLITLCTLVLLTKNKPTHEASPQ